MAFQWTITSIAVGKISPQEQLFPTTNTDGQRVDPANPIIWQPGVNYQNGTDGSTNPVTFQLPTATDQTWMLPMTLSGSITFPAAWYGTRFKLVGSLNGTAIVENDPMVATVAPVWSFSQLRLLSALPFVNPRDPSYAFLIPFRISGDWTWAIQPVSLPSKFAIIF